MFFSPPRFLGKDYCSHQFRSFVRLSVRKNLGEPSITVFRNFTSIAPQSLVVHLWLLFFNFLGKPCIAFFQNFCASCSLIIGYPLQQPIVCKKSSSWLKSRFCHQLVVDNLLFLAQIDDGSFANYALTIRGLTRHYMKTESMSLFI